MILALAMTVGAVLQGPATRITAGEPVRVWRSDSLLHVALREPGHLLLLHVDAIGRIRVLFPVGPGDNTAVSTDAFTLTLPPTAQGNPTTIVAVRSRWPFEFTALRDGARWNYADAWLLQPTAGDPIAALLEIADRVTDGRPYDYGVVTYLRDGTVAARRTPLQPDVCLSCVRQGAPVSTASAAPQTNNVDCSNASLTNAFCGVANGNVSITNETEYEQPAPAEPVVQTTYVPYFLPLFIREGRFARRARLFERPTPAPPRMAGVAFPIAPRLIVPSSGDLHTYSHRH